MLEIHALGHPLVISRNGQPIRVLPRKARALLVYTALQEAPVPRSKLADLLWPYQGTDQARHSLRNALLELRKSLGAAAFEVRADFSDVWLEPCWVDTREFSRLGACDEADSIRCAYELFRGPLLAEFDINSEPWNEWLILEREKFELAVIDLCFQLIALTAKTDTHYLAIEAARRAIAIAPFDESCHRALMLVLAQGGQHTAALQCFEGMRRLLAEELQIGPAAETLDLRATIACREPLPTLVFDRRSRLTTPRVSAARLVHAAPNLVGPDADKLLPQLLKCGQELARSARSGKIRRGELAVASRTLLEAHTFISRLGIGEQQRIAA